MSYIVTVGLTAILILAGVIVLSDAYPPFKIIQQKTMDLLPIILAFSFFMSIDTYFRNSTTASIQQQASLAEKSWVHVYDKIQSSYDTCPNFCNSLTYAWQVPESLKLQSDKEDNYECVLSISILIFQTFSNILMYYLYNDTDDSFDEWVRALIVWANSDMLYQIWNANDFIYSDVTRIFIDEVFTATRAMPPANQDDVVSLARQICNSDKIASLFKMFDKRLRCSQAVVSPIPL